MPRTSVVPTISIAALLLALATLAPRTVAHAQATQPGSSANVPPPPAPAQYGMPQSYPAQPQPYPVQPQPYPVQQYPAQPQPQPYPQPYPQQYPQQQPYPPQPQVYPQPQPYYAGQQPYPTQAYYGGYPQPRPRVSRGLMITGISIFAGSYLLSLIVGIQIRSDAYYGSDRQIGNRLLIPLVGPFVAMPVADPNDRGLLALLGVPQLAGAVLTVFGVRKFIRSKNAVRASQGMISFDLDRGRSLAIDADLGFGRYGLSSRLRF